MRFAFNRLRSSKLIVFCFTIAIITLLFTISFSNVFCQAPAPGNVGTRTLYLIRHGQYDHEDKRDPDVGKNLVSLGIAQSRLVAARLKSLPVHMTSLLSSTMTRARQTAMIINESFPELELQQSRIIRECTPPTWREDIMDREDPENMQECEDQLEESFSEYFIPSPDSDDRHDIIVCHGNVIRYFVTKVLKVDTKSWLQMTTGNCGLTIIRIKSNGTMRLVTFNDMAHIPQNLQTETGSNNMLKDLHLPE